MPTLLVYPNKLILKDLDNNYKLPTSITKPLTEYDTFSKYPKINFIAIKQIFINNKIAFVFPKNISITTFKSNIKDLRIEDGSIDNNYIEYKDNKIEFNTNYDFLNEYQEKCSEYLSNYYFENVLAMHTGSGKTYSIIRFISENKYRAAIFVENTELIENPWIKDILKFTNLKREDICVIQGINTVKKEIKRLSEKNSIKHSIYIFSNKTISSLLKNKENYKLAMTLFNLAEITIKVFDEAHLGYKNVFSNGVLFDSFMTIYASATLERASYASNKVFQFIIPSKDIWFGKDYVERKYIDVYRYDLKTKPNDREIYKVSKSHLKTYSIDEYHEYFINNEYAYQKLIERLTKLSLFLANKKQCNTLIIFKNLNLVQKIANDLNNVSELENNIGMFTSLIEDKETKKKELSKKVILSTTKSIDAGIDFNLDSIILFSPLTAYSAVKQLCSRIRYKDETRYHLVFDIFDSSFECVLNSAIQRKRVFNKFAREVIDKF